MNKDCLETKHFPVRTPCFDRVWQSDITCLIHGLAPLYNNLFGHPTMFDHVWWHVHKVSCLGLSGEKVTFLLAHFPRGLQIYLLSHTSKLNRRKSRFLFGPNPGRLQFYTDWDILVNWTGKKVHFFLARIPGRLQLNKLTYTSKLKWRKSAFLFGPISRPFTIE